MNRHVEFKKVARRIEEGQILKDYNTDDLYNIQDSCFYNVLSDATIEGLIDYYFDASSDDDFLRYINDYNTICYIVTNKKVVQYYCIVTMI